MPRAKMVGYMMDMKKLLRNRAATESQPRCTMITAIRIVLISPKTASVRWALQ